MKKVIYKVTAKVLFLVARGFAFVSDQLDKANAEVSEVAQELLEEDKGQDES